MGIGWGSFRVLLGGPHIASQYDVGLAIPGLVAGTVAHGIPTLAVIDGQFQAQGHDGLLGPRGGDV
jgi:hypothetical protein